MGRFSLLRRSKGVGGAGYICEGEALLVATMLCCVEHAATDLFVLAGCYCLIYLCVVYRWVGVCLTHTYCYTRDPLAPQWKYDEASCLYQRCIEIHEKSAGPNHPDVAASVHDKAATLLAQVPW